MSLPIVYVLTSNPRKRAAWERDLRRYRVDLRFAEADASPQSLFGENVIAVCRETSNLYEPGLSDLSDRRDLSIVESRCDLRVYLPDGDGVGFSEAQRGYIDLGGASPDASEWWDSIFKPFSTHLSYETMLQEGTLKSPRDMAVGHFIVRFLHFPQRTGHRHIDVVPAEAVDFGLDPEAIFAKTTLLHRPWVRSFGILEMLDTAVNEGLFFRAAQSQRDRNYWCPPFSGVPLVPKKDIVHETTFTVHDISHQILPDFLFVGSPGVGMESVAPILDLERRLYIAQRMMSEAMTLVIADMVFVDALRRSGVEYDFTKRRIYPLFQSIRLSDLNLNFLEKLKGLLWASVSYAVLGDGDAWLHLAGGSRAAFDTFREKYDAFFIEDFRWTARNWQSLTEQPDRFSTWRALVDPLGANLPPSTSEMVARLNLKPQIPTHDLVLRLFEWNWQERLYPIFSQQRPRLSPTERRRNAFRRWLSGQFGLFVDMGQGAEYAEVITSYLRRHPAFDLAEMNQVRAFYNEFVRRIAADGYIDRDDEITYKSVYPLFEPFYVFYDRKTDAMLSDVARETLAPQGMDRRAGPS